MTSPRGLCFINDQPCGLGWWGESEGNIFHMTPPRISAERQQLRGRAKEKREKEGKKKKTSNFVALKGVKSSAPYSRRFEFIITARVRRAKDLLKKKEGKPKKAWAGIGGGVVGLKSHLLSKHLSFILL